MRHSYLTSLTSVVALSLSTLHLSAQIPFVIGEQSHQYLSEMSDTPRPERTYSNFQTTFTQNSPVDPIQVPRALYTADNGITVWGNVVYSRTWEEAGEIPSFNAYTFTGDDGLVVDQIAQDKWMFANGSGSFYDGKFHFISKGSTTYLYGLYDVDTWTLLFQEQSPYRFHKLVATDCDYDPVTGLTYGCYWNPDTKEYEFASVDYESYTHTTIAPMEIFSAIAIDSKGQVYGIKESDGGLYRIDKTTGEQTFIGSTGVTPYLIQSAAFDRTTDVMYWAVRAAGSVAYLATVNTDNASVKRLAYFPDSEQITCLYVPSPAAAGAPAKVTDATISATSSANAFEVAFNLPTKSSDGSLLPATALSYTVSVAGKPAISGEGQPGSRVTREITLAEGYNAIAITAANATGNGIPVDRRVWNGNDTPVAVRNVSITVDNNNDNKVTIAWDAPEYGVHNGYIGADKLTFDIVRMPDNTVVADHISGTSFSETLGMENAGIYYYVITPYADGLAGEAAETAKITASGVYSLPYSETFDTQASFNSFVTLDINGDSKTWFWNEKMQLAEYYANWNADADDWMLSPEVAMRAGQLYVVSFDYRGWDPSSPEKLRVAIGTGTDVGSYTDIMPLTEVKSSEMATCQLIISVPVDGAYRIGFHCTSSRYSMYLLVDNFEVTVGPDAGAPAAPSSLEIIPDEEGHLTATVQFLVPETCADGSELTDKVDVLLYRNGNSTPVKTFEAVSPGKTLRYSDTTDLTGVNTYSVVARNAAGQGLATTASAYIGQDRPDSPSAVTLTDCDDHFTLTWEAPSTTGISRPSRPVIPSELTYNVYAPDRSLLCEGLTELTYDIPERFTQGEPNLVNFHVSAVSPAGEGAQASSNYLLTGRAYDLPFSESFAGGAAPSTYWWVGGNNVFQPTSETSYDGDGGCIRWRNTYWDKNSWFNSARLNIAPAKSPVFTFAYLMKPGKKFVIKSYISPKGGEDQLLGEINFETASGAEEWLTASYDLSAYQDCDYVILKLYVECAEAYSYSEPLYFYVDRIEVTDTEGANLTAASINAPASLFVNQTGEINVAVSNSATSAVPYTVNLYVDGEMVESRSVESIEPQSLDKLTFRYTPTVTTPDRITISALIECEQDLYPGDNATASVAIDIQRPDYPVVGDLAVEGNLGAVTLTWSEPAQTDRLIDETFEDYIHKDTRFGDWTTIDNDLGNCYTNQLVDVGFMNIPVSWVIFNTIAAGVPEEDAEAYAPHSGTTAAIALLSQPETINSGNFTDDWLVSPELSASEVHNVTFWAKSVKGEKYGEIPFEVVYTDGYPNDVDGFKIHSSLSAPADWAEYSAELPEGTRFFAIRFLTESGLYMMVDDICFNTGIMDIKGYSVFRDGVKIGNTAAGVTTFTDSDADTSTDHIYQVTVRYTNGESILSEGALYKASSALSIPGVSDEPFDVYSIDGIVVRRNTTSLEGLPRGFYIVNNVKIAVL